MVAEGKLEGDGKGSTSSRGSGGGLGWRFEDFKNPLTTAFLDIGNWVLRRLVLSDRLTAVSLSWNN